MDALKRFQHDQNLIEDGKVGSLSLIALGLGPKRAAAPAKPADSTKGAEALPADPIPPSDSPAPTEVAPQ